MKKKLLELFMWPAKPGNGFVPWFVVIWRLIFAPLVYGGLVIAWVGVALTYGLSSAMNFWHNAFRT